MTCIDELLIVARAYAAHEGIGLKTVSWRLFGDTKKLAAITGGADIQTKRFEGAMQWLSTHWPAGLAWPVGAERPRAVAA